MGKKPVKYCVVDAFTDSAFKGNPAAVCMLEEDRDDTWLESVAAEFNMSQTCYLTRVTTTESDPTFRLRWFTPVAEVKLCGHATLAASHFLFTSGLVDGDVIEFLTLSGILTAKKVRDPKHSNSSQLQNGHELDDFSVELDFPIIRLTEFNCLENSTISQILNGASTVEIKKTTGDDLFVVLPSGKTVAELQPQFDVIEKLPGRGLIITGLAPPGSGFDFYSRFFCPKLGIREDPVCGSAHCALGPYWCQKLGKRDCVAYQASPRGGIIYLHLDEKNQRIFLRGKAITVMEGHPKPYQKSASDHKNLDRVGSLCEIWSVDTTVPWREVLATAEAPPIPGKFAYLDIEKGVAYVRGTHADNVGVLISL